MKYYISKIIRAYKDKTLFFKLNIYFKNCIMLPFDVFRFSLLNFQKFKKIKFKIINEHNKSFKNSLHIIKQITNSYTDSKKIEIDNNSPFKVQGLWSEWLDINYKDLIKKINDHDLLNLTKLLENMFQEPFTRGFSIFDGYIRLKRPLGKYYYFLVWQKYFELLVKENHDSRLLNFPRVGNPSGIVFNNQVIPFETIRHCYFAQQFRELLKGVVNPIVVEIGGGFGGFAQQILSQYADKKIKYILYDLPEVNIISTFFLMKSFPNKKFLLFNNNDPWDYSIDFDIAILPHFEVSKIPPLSVDLFYNACSFSEMSKESAKAYLDQIEISGKNYFAHENHDVRFSYFHNGVKSENLLGSEIVPDKLHFKRIYKKERVFGLPEDRSYKSFEYLYQRYKQ